MAAGARFQNSFQNGFQPMTRITNPKETIIAVPASGGAAVIISATKTARYIEIQECAPSTYNNTGNAPFAPQGLVYQKPDDNYVASFPLLPGEIVAIGDNNWRSKASIGWQGATDPAGNSIPATPYIKVLSATATATQVRLREWS
jgi:hypothetical protein